MGVRESDQFAMVLDSMSHLVELFVRNVLILETCWIWIVALGRLFRAFTIGRESEVHRISEKARLRSELCGRHGIRQGQ